MTKELVVGGIFLTAVALVGYLTLQIQGFEGGGEYELTAEFDDVAGLATGDQVRYRGFHVGKVNSLEVGSSGAIRVTLLLSQELTPRESATLTVKAASALGGSIVDYDPGTGNEVPVDSLRGSSSNLMDELGAIVAENRDSIREIVEDLRTLTNDAAEGPGLVKSLLSDATIAEDFKTAVADFRKIVEGVQEGIENDNSILGALLRDEGLATNARKTFDNAELLTADLQAMAADARAGKGTLGMLLTDDELASEIRTLVGNLDRSATDFGELVAEVRKGDGILAKIINDDVWAESFFTTLKNVEEIAAKVNSGDGAFAQLLNDPTLIEEASRLLTLLRESTEDAREQAPINSFVNVLFAGF
ncbi:MAG: MlaD family protein [Planctomycetota bacterium]